jgi:hypothetical protein
MAKAIETETKEAGASEKGFNIQEKVGKLGNDVDSLAKKTGDEALKLAKNIN